MQTLSDCHSSVMDHRVWEGAGSIYITWPVYVVHPGWSGDFINQSFKKIVPPPVQLILWSIWTPLPSLNTSKKVDPLVAFGPPLHVMRYYVRSAIMHENKTWIHPRIIPWHATSVQYTLEHVHTGDMIPLCTKRAFHYCLLHIRHPTYAENIYFLFRLDFLWPSFTNERKLLHLYPPFLKTLPQMPPHPNWKSSGHFPMARAVAKAIVNSPQS